MNRLVSSDVHPALVQAPLALHKLLRGFEQFSTLLAFMLGPTKGSVLYARSRLEPEVLQDSATVATRVIALPERAENIGAMMVRSMAMGIHERYGDGAATGAVLAVAALREAVKRITAGANPDELKRGMELGLSLARAALLAQAQLSTGQDDLTSIATNVTNDAALGALLGEAVDVLGDQASLAIEESYTPYLDREYVSGGQWDVHVADPYFLPEQKAGIDLHQPLIMIVDEVVSRLDQVQSALELAVQHPDKPPLVIVANGIEQDALKTLLLNHTRGILTVAPAIITSGLTGIDLADMAVLVGAQVLNTDQGCSPRHMRLEYFGRARKATLTRNGLVIVAGQGDPVTLRQRLVGIRSRLQQLDHADKERATLKMRQARLTGGIGVIKVGAYSEHERERKKESIEKALLVLEAVQMYGTVPGGGIAYLACLPSLQTAMHGSLCEDVRGGLAVVAGALEAPFLQLVKNYGLQSPLVALGEVQRHGGDYGFDALRGKYVCMRECGIIDSTYVICGVLEAAINTAMMAMTTDTIVHTM
ncbi:TCP-1/cpn60 chaperonin family protein [Dictyobacter kobayashii]|uniref:60 kDa chaperonin n=1 Tax=Dictyobacter kobayashii TaxID=2014872 RepID=A0A402ASR7_9CHLR|nr:TCP-1/cpn60 chaperonin family protein [Dictyobacter kobayashii]GCE22168.1 60 kDa chaperonin [Dictyobacter kobayashii]